MAKLFSLMFVWGPAMVGLSLGWLIPHPDDWTGPAVLGPVGVVVTALTYRVGLVRYRTADARVRPYCVIGMSAGALTGVALFLMLALGFIG